MPTPAHRIPTGISLREACEGLLRSTGADDEVLTYLAETPGAWILDPYIDDVAGYQPAALDGTNEVTIVAYFRHQDWEINEDAVLYRNSNPTQERQ